MTTKWQQHPGINQPGIEIKQTEMWVVNETAYNSKPNGITVRFYRPSDWNTGIQEFTFTKIITFLCSGPAH